MAEKTYQSSDNFAIEKKTKSLEKSNHSLGGVSGHPFVDSEQPLIVISDCSVDSQINSPKNVPLKFQNAGKEDGQKGTNYTPPFASSSWPRLKRVTQLSQRDNERFPLGGRNDKIECLNFKKPVAEAAVPSGEDAPCTKPDHTEIPGICWEDYKSFLFRVWKENSLDNSSLEDESSTLPSISSLSGDVPYVIELLTKEEESLLPNEPAIPQSSFYGRNLMDPKQNLFIPSEKRRSSPNINFQSFSILEKNSQPRPLAKETSNIQGEATSRPTLLLRPNAVLEPLKEGGSNLPKTQKTFNKTLNAFSEKEHKMAPRDINNKTNINQSLTNKANDKRLNLSLASNQQKPVFQNYETGTNLSQINQLNLHDRGQLHLPEMEQPNRHRMGLCFHRDEIQNLKAELEMAQSRIASLSFKMEDQSTHLERLIEERNAHQDRFNEFLQSQPPVNPGMTYPLFPQQGYKNPHLPMYPTGMEAYSCNPHHQSIGRRASWQYPCDLPTGRIPSGCKGTERHEDLMSHLRRSDPRALEDLRDRIVALQMQNIELNLFLKKEEMRRKEAEDAVRKEKEYVRKLQESIQDISSSTLVIDPLTYKQVADNYIASKKKPVRRTHTCNPYIGSSDLVCDSNRLQVIQNKTQSNSCPSSPLGSNHDRKSSSSKLSSSSSVENHLQGSSPTCSMYSLQETDPTTVNPSLNWSMEVRAPSPPVSNHQYQELLNCLDGLQVSSSPS